MKRDAPDVFERFKAGRYKSVRAAAIDAGIPMPARSNQRSPYLSKDPNAAAQKLIDTFGDEWCAELCAELKRALFALMQAEGIAASPGGE